MNIREYDRSDKRSIYDYSKGLLNKTLRDFLESDEISKMGKGKLGQLVEEIYFGIKNNPNPRPDFEEAGVELKCTPLNTGSNGEYLIKERLVCNMINYCEVVTEDFEHSHFYLKCQLMLIIFYLHKSDASPLDLMFIFSVLWKLEEKDLLIIKQDYNIIITKIIRGEAHLLSEGDTMYLGACRKGQKDDGLVEQPNSDIKAPKRAFCLKMAYMRTILDFAKKSKYGYSTNVQFSGGQLVSAEELKAKSFEELIIGRFGNYFGKNYRDIAKECDIDLSRNPKNMFAMIANSISANGKKVSVNQSEEFKKAGLTMKTIRVNAHGTIKEAMSFENINYSEVNDCENWYDSRLYEIFSSRFMFVVFREQNANKGDYILDDAFFWTMPQSDLEKAEQYWQHIKAIIKADKIDDNYWWKSKDEKLFHVRPKASKSTDCVLSPSGKKVKKFCYWFNNSYIKEIVSKRQEIRNEK